MEGSSLFNPGFLGGNFNWWVGQVSDDSVWRDNIIPTVHSDKNTNPGWGYRYKVRILGIHDWGEESIASEDLPWAQVMYPITSGGGQGAAFATPAIRQGNMVMGFFMDQQDQQIPVIMGVLGNNQQQPKSTTVGDNSVTNEKSGTIGKSSITENKQKPTPENLKQNLTDENAATTKPTDTSDQAAKEKDSFCAAPKAGVKVDKYGRDPTKRPPSAVKKEVDAAREEAKSRGITGEALDDIVGKATMDASKNYCKAKSSPNTPSKGSAALEAVDGVHTGTVDETKKQTEGGIKTVMLSPCDPPSSAMSGIQTALDNLMVKIDGWLATITSYIDAASAIINSLKDMKSLLERIACEIAKYMKILMDKMMEYVLKMLNKTLTIAVAAIPSTMRHMFGDIKEIITELILCLYNKLTDSMCAMIADLLKGAFPLEDLQAQAQEAADNDEISDDKRTAPQVPMCYAEDLIGQTIAAHQLQIEDANQSILDNVSSFITDIQEEMAGVTDAFAEITSPLGDIMGSITAALGFENLTLNILGCELAPNCPVADYYTLEDGGSAQSDTQDSSAKGVGDATAKNAGGADAAATTDPGYSQPTSAQQDQDLTETQSASDSSKGYTVDKETSEIKPSGPKRTQEETDYIKGGLDIY